MKAALLLLFAVVAMAVGWHARPLYEQEIEARRVYGKTPDYAKPWGQSACMQIAKTIASNKWVKLMGGRKSLVMAQIAAGNDGNDDLDELLGEFSRAWDSDIDAYEWFKSCMQKLEEFQNKKTL